MVKEADLSDQVTVVTGANSGIGYEAALTFAQRGAGVALVCRDRARGETALDAIKRHSGNNNVNLFLADFSQLKSIPILARQLLNTYPRIHVLCNNAGSVRNQHEITDEGYEWTSADNDCHNAAGRYFYRRKVAETADFATEEAAQKLWQVSMDLTKPYLPKSAI